MAPVLTWAGRPSPPPKARFRPPGVTRTLDVVSTTRLLTVRATGDRCPGALRLHDAADGALARIRVPGGILTADAAGELARLAATTGDGAVHLTIRGNVELRGIADPAALFEGLAGAGLLPSPAHERARNIIASPLAGLDDAGRCGPAGLAPLVRRLDAAICAEPDLAALSGRFCFGLDDGRGDIVAQRPDVGVRLTGEQAAQLVVDGAETPVHLATDEVPAALVAAATSFVASPEVVTGGAWRIRDASSSGLASRLATAAAAGRHAARPQQPTAPAPLPFERPDHPVGTIAAQGDSRVLAVAAILPLGVTAAANWRALGEWSRRGDGMVRTTGWRGVIIGGIPAQQAPEVLRDLAGRGLIVDPADPRRRLSACTGQPGCHRALADVHTLALASAPAPGSESGCTDADLLAGRSVFWAGCERRCGHPSGPHVTHLATPDGIVAGQTR